MRWLAALVSAVIAFVVVGLIAQLLVAQLRNQALVDVAGAFAAVFAFIYAGVTVAPSRRRAMFAFTVIALLLPVLVLALFVIDPSGPAAAGQSIATPIAQIAGGATAILFLRFQSARAGR